jgi:hypothetical protein
MKAEDTRTWWRTAHSAAAVVLHVFMFWHKMVLPPDIESNCDATNSTLAGQVGCVEEAIRRTISKGVSRQEWDTGTFVLASIACVLSLVHLWVAYMSLWAKWHNFQGGNRECCGKFRKGCDSLSTIAAFLEPLGGFALQQVAIWQASLITYELAVLWTHAGDHFLELCFWALSFTC